MAYTVQGGSRTFTDLLKNAGLESPFDEACLRGVCAEAEKALADFDLTGIESWANSTKSTAAANT